MLLALAAFIAASFVYAPKEKVNWMSFEEMEAAYAREPRPILVDLYTDWCGWCKHMDNTTYKNAQVVAYINTHYYAVKYNAESKSAVRFNNKVYQYNAKYRTNDLAMFLSFGDLSYPNTIFLSGLDARPAPLAGYLAPKDFEAPLKYFAERKSEQESFVEFNQKLKKEWQ